MAFQRFFQDVIGLADTVCAPEWDPRIPAVITEADLWNARLPESILETDVRVLGPENLYQVGRYTVFAEEAQCVVRWAVIDSRNDSDCFILNHEEPVNTHPEEFKLTGVLLGMIVNNALSSNLLEHYRYETLPAEYAATIKRNIPPVGGFSDVRAIVHNDVACMLEVGDELLVSAASRSKDSLNSFIGLIKGMGSDP